MRVETGFNHLSGSEELTGKAMQEQRKNNLFIIGLMNLTVYPLIVLWTVVGIMLSPFAIALLKGVKRWSIDRIVRFLIWFYGRGWMTIVSPFVRFERKGFQDERIAPPCIFVVNHLSFFDTYCMAMLPISNVVFAVRSWPFKMPWYTPFMRMSRYLDVERLGWKKTAEEGTRLLNQSSALLFFPEGHRSRDGNLGRFYSGAFKVAIDCNAKIVPLCITGTKDLLPTDRWWLKPARIRLCALPPVDPDQFCGPSAHIQLRKHVKKQIAKQLAQPANRGPIRPVYISSPTPAGQGVIFGEEHRTQIADGGRSVHTASPADATGGPLTDI